ncbi:nicotinate phosphoribosyltransferase [Sphingobacteriales bacterium UPWRP_1]|nr:nicotinate phosphoribosyltransferase [Sphingobacteriales bacterium TSM_CSM]PSJ76774.1 nicotinate phosphoribosyltransferase [Sphingobacteriales bacterium UPWRP_1]
MLSEIYKTSLSLLTDLYQLTMAYGYFKNGIANRQAVFHLFYRKQPFKGNYAIACGLEYAIDYINNLRFTGSDIAYLATLTGSNKAPLFDDAFLKYLSEFTPQCHIDAIPEGTVVFAHEPLVRVQAGLLEAQLLETPLLNIINFQTLIATKAARVCKAAKGDAVLEFGLRRAQGIDGGLCASRAAFAGGCAATSNVLAGKLFGIPVRGTHAHSWVMCFDTELESFAAYAKAMPNNCIFLVDTYNTIEGVKNAVKIGNWLRQNGHDLLGIRLDSGDLGQLSKQARQILDQNGFTNAVITASNDLDEYKIAELKASGATIGLWGVGTNLVTAQDQPALGGVYKLGAIQNNIGQWQYRLKLSEEVVKTSNPGMLQVCRFSDAHTGQWLADMLYSELEGNLQMPATMHTFAGQKLQMPPDVHCQNLLQPVFRNGKQVYQLPSLAQIQARTKAQLQQFENSAQPYPAGLENNLFLLKQQLIHKLETNA